MQRRKLTEALSDLPIGALRYFDRLGSTNEAAARWAAEGAPDCALVVADEQTAGRGRLGRRWFTPPGAALAFSLVLRPLPSRALDSERPGAQSQKTAVHPAQGEACIPRSPHLLTALGALAVSDALHDCCGLAAQIKWPNDVLVNGRKLGGVLTEAQWQGDVLVAVILGIGINVAPASVPGAADVLFPATCVETELGKPVDRWVLLRAVLAALLDWRSRADSVALVTAWETRLAFRGEWVRVTAALGAAPPSGQTGMLLGLDSEGALRLRSAEGREVTVRAGDVHLRVVDKP